jgi:omega-amidase
VISELGVAENMPRNKIFKAGVVQFQVQKGEVEANWQKARRGLQRLATKGVRLAVLPEMWSSGFAYGQLREMAEKSPVFLRYLGELASTYEMVIVGSVPELADGNIYNTAVVLDHRGRCAGSYRKIHLFTLHEEDRHFSGGDSPVVCDTQTGRLGVLICYDLRFPELARAMALRGATVLVVPAQWPTSRISHWRTLLRARAIENQLFMVACNACGSDDRLQYGGASAIISPWGEPLAEAGSEEVELTAELDFAEIEVYRQMIPCFADRVPGAYD